MEKEPTNKPGYLYILRGPDKLTVKIGFSENPERRCDELYTGLTSVPYGFVIIDKVYVDNMKHYETTLHNLLIKYRVNSKREFFGFNIDPETESLDVHYKRLKKEVIEPCIQIFNILRMQISQPEAIPIPTPEEQKLYTQKLIEDENRNIIDKFIESNIIVNKNNNRSKITLQELNSTFKTWYEETYGKNQWNISIKKLHDYFDKKYGEREKRNFWSGIRINYQRYDIGMPEGYDLDLIDDLNL